MIRALNWGWRIALVYTSFALATLGFVAFAMTQRVDLVRSDYYEQSLQHDQHAQAVANVQALGSSVSLQVREGMIEFVAPVDHAGANVSIALYRPDAPADDKTYKALLDQQGRATIHVKDLRPGLWRVRVDWKVSTRAYHFETSFTQ